MTLWTPDGEHHVPRPSRDNPATQSPSPPTPTDEDSDRALAEALGVDFDALSPQEREQLAETAQEMIRTRERLAAVPAAEVIANHLMGFYELAAIHLGSQPPRFEDATLAIDSLRAVLDGLGARLGDIEPTFRQALSQLQLAFVQQKRATVQADGNPAEGSSGS